MAVSIAQRFSIFAEQMPMLRDMDLVRNASMESRAWFVAKVYAMLAVQYGVVAVIAIFSSQTVAEVLKSFNGVVIGVLVVMIAATFAGLYTSGALRLFPMNWLIYVALTCSLGLIAAFIDALLGWHSAALGSAILTTTFIFMLSVAVILQEDFASSPLAYVVTVLLVVVLAQACLVALYLMKVELDLGVTVDVPVLVGDAVVALSVCIYAIFDQKRIMNGSHDVDVALDEHCFTVLLLYWDFVSYLLLPLALFGGRGEEEGDRKPEASGQ